MEGRRGRSLHAVTLQQSDISRFFRCSQSKRSRPNDFTKKSSLFPELSGHKNFVAFCCVLWHFVAFCGILWRFVAFCGILWRFVAFCGTILLTKRQQQKEQLRQQTTAQQTTLKAAARPSL
jgi:hypothetical protein